jgi:hypothetical protein
MQLEIDRELAALGGMSTGQLCKRYSELFGSETRTRHKAYLIRKLAWRLQALAEGDLSERAKRRAQELANDVEIRVMPPRITKPQSVTLQVPTEAIGNRLPAPGTAIVRNYKGRQLRVFVLNDGFEYEGERFQSLSAVARTITGSHCNGFRFFNLKGKA